MDKLEKITRPARRRYDDACAAAHGLDLLGERWALLVVRELTLGPRRFSDLRAGLPGLSANVLTQRLEGLEASGILRRRHMPPPSGASVYELTEWGLEVEPVIRAIGRWAARSPLHDPSLSFSPASLVLSLRTMFEPARAGALQGRACLLVEGERYRLALRGGLLLVDRRAEPFEADGGLEGDARALALFVYGGVALEEGERQGLWRASGERAFLRALPPLFPLPPKAPGPVQPGKS